MIEKALFWMGSSLDDLKEFPKEVQDQMGYAFCSSTQSDGDRYE